MDVVLPGRFNLVILALFFNICYEEYLWQQKVVYMWKQYCKKKKKQKKN